MNDQQEIPPHDPTPDELAERIDPGPYGLDRRYYSLKHAAGLLGASHHGLRLAATRRRIDARKIREQWYIPRAEVARLMERVDPTPAPSDPRPRPMHE